MMRSLIEDCKRFFNGSPSTIEVKEVLCYYLALNRDYQIDKNHMPLPIWRRKGFEDDGNMAWDQLKQITKQISPDRGLSIYIHVPFCPSRCSFCDCLTMQLRNHVDRVLDRYLKALRYEIEAWVDCGTTAERPVTTIHFGGGTPLFLGLDRFSRLVNALNDAFNIQPETEWALETTSASLNPPMLEQLTQLGFRRLHLGVQTMEEYIRPLLKRRESASQVLDKLRRARTLGWITSVDLLVGLPFETPAGLLAGINALMDAGTDGFSVYEINISSQNIRFAKEYRLLERDRRENYFLFVAAVNHLLKIGFKKNLFNHFANQQDLNLYFTYPMRGEDCLAMGAYADGAFENYHYRHSDYRMTIEDTIPTRPALQGGIKRSPLADRLFPIENILLSGEFTEEQLNQVLPTENVVALIQPWKAALLIEDSKPGSYSLTPNGAWFSGNMIADLEKVAGAHA